MKKPCNIIGPQVRVLRESSKLTQEQLAARCQRLGFDITRDTLAKIETQVRRIADGELFLLSRALDTPIAAFFPAASEVKRFVSSPGFKRN